MGPLHEQYRETVNQSRRLLERSGHLCSWAADLTRQSRELQIEIRKNAFQRAGRGRRLGKPILNAGSSRPLKNAPKQ
jgi:hypothetical protein